MTIFACTHISKEVSEDHFENGCAIQRTLVIDQSASFVSDSLKGLFHEISKAFCLKFDSLFVRDANDLITVGWNRVENGDGDAPSPSEVEQWKTGKLTMYLADWTFWIESREVRTITLDELKSTGFEIHD